MQQNSHALDKLTISGYLAAKSVQVHIMPQKQYSDAAVNHIFEKLSQPNVTKKREIGSWNPQAQAMGSAKCSNGEALKSFTTKRRNNSF
jgi:uncharacterized UBP type Zn finger protein